MTHMAHLVSVAHNQVGLPAHYPFKHAVGQMRPVRRSGVRPTTRLRGMSDTDHRTRNRSISGDTLPFTVLVPSDGMSPIEVFDQHAALKMAVVERTGASVLSDEWDAPGVYLLVDRHGADGTWGVYVGKAPAGIKARLGSHLRNKDHWYRAVLIRRDTTYGFNSAQIGWLEGRLHDLLVAAEDAQLHNANRPSDETLPPYDRQMLELVVVPVARLLRLIGHDPMTTDDATSPSTQRSSRFYGISLAQIVDSGLLEVGSQLVSTNGAWPASAIVRDGGQIEVADVVYATPSAAATAVKDGPANGWDFWSVHSPSGRVSLATLRANYLLASKSTTNFERNSSPPIPLATED